MRFLSDVAKMAINEELFDVDDVENLDTDSSDEEDHGDN